VRSPFGVRPAKKFDDEDEDELEYDFLNERGKGRIDATAMLSSIRSILPF
jgi:hypothetical protein